MGEGDGGWELKEGMLRGFEKGGEEEVLCEGRNMSIDIMPGVYFNVSS